MCHLEKTIVLPVDALCVFARPGLPLIHDRQHRAFTRSPTRQTPHPYPSNPSHVQQHHGTQAKSLGGYLDLCIGDLGGGGSARGRRVVPEEDEGRTQGQSSAQSKKGGQLSQPSSFLWAVVRVRPDRVLTPLVLRRPPRLQPAAPFPCPSSEPVYPSTGYHNKALPETWTLPAKVINSFSKFCLLSSCLTTPRSAPGRRHQDNVVEHHVAQVGLQHQAWRFGTSRSLWTVFGESEYRIRRSLFDSGL